MLMSLRSPWFFQLKKKVLCNMQFPWHWAFLFCLFPQGSWSFFQLKKENFWLGRDGLRLDENWIIQENEAFEYKKHTHIHTHTRQRVVIHKKSVSFTEFIEPTANAGISVSVQHLMPPFVSPFWSFFCLRRILGPPGNFSFMRIKWRALHP